MPKRRPGRRLVAAAIVTLAMVVALVAVVLAGAYWVAFLTLLVAWLALAFTKLKNS